VYTPGSRPTDGAAGKGILCDLGNSWKPRPAAVGVEASGCSYSRVPPGLLDGAAVADEIKKVRPRLPIVRLAESLELPEGALKSVDAPVTNCDGPRFL